MTSPVLASYLNTQRRQKRRVARFRDEPPGGQVGVAYEYEPAVTGGVSPYAVTVDSGALPDGLTLTDGTISGTPTVAGSTVVWLQVEDADGVKSWREFEFAIAGA